MERQPVQDAAVGAGRPSIGTFPRLTVLPSRAEDAVSASQYGRNARPSCARPVVLDARREGGVMAVRRAGPPGWLVGLASLAALVALARPASGQG
jgi:hypothetical protein